MGIPHRVYHGNQPYARSERVELAVETEIRSVPMVEFQFTLRHQTRPKIKDFLRAAIRRTHQHVPRVYLEIDHPDELNVEAIGDRVAKTIRDIAYDVARRGHAYAREAGNVIGLTLGFDAEGKRLTPTPLSLLAMIGTEARAYIVRTVASMIAAHKRAYLKAWHRAKEANRQERLDRRAERPTLRQTVLFYLRGAHPDVAPAFVPIPALVATQLDYPLRMPYRR
jgi:hypothetical protein